MDASAPEYLTGVAAWENPWPYEDIQPQELRPSEGATPTRGGNLMLETRDEPKSAFAATWHSTCALDDLSVGTGTCVLVGQAQIALFRVEGDLVRAVQNICPHKGAAAMHQGLVGEKAGQPAVFCPLHKRAYSLDDGRCLEEEGGGLRSYRVRIVGGMVEVEA